MKAVIENGLVTAIVYGDADCGVNLNDQVDVACGWRYERERFFPPQGLSEAQKNELNVEEARAWRNSELSRTEWLVTRHREELELEKQTSLGVEKYRRLLVYRQGLRDWPLCVGFPEMEGKPQLLDLFVGD